MLLLLLDVAEEGEALIETEANVTTIMNPQPGRIYYTNCVQCASNSSQTTGTPICFGHPFDFKTQETRDKIADLEKRLADAEADLAAHRRVFYGHHSTFSSAQKAYEELQRRVADAEANAVQWQSLVAKYEQELKRKAELLAAEQVRYAHAEAEGARMKKALQDVLDNAHPIAKDGQSTFGHECSGCIAERALSQKA